ncbi:MAG: 5-(carboxyamino)imidazole ribonucleotide mutase [Candidatus Levybacteria bacterium]|nr:5-(carboxyamino)imidazole ribonucleotide mutase [Candidatus Levybacteria bacterium]
MKEKKVAIIVGSDSDLPVMSQAAKILEEFGVDFSITVSSAHRSPDLTVKNIEEYYKNGVKVIIAGAGMAAHLAGVAASHFPLPVIGVPIKSGALNGVDSLCSTVQMPPGIPVATVGVDNAKNAGLLAVQILAVSDNKLEEKLIDYKRKLKKGVEDKAEKLKKEGLINYLSTLSKAVQK